MKRKLNQKNEPVPSLDLSTSQDLSDFSSFGLDARLLQAIAQHGFTSPTLVQAKTIPLALEGKDILGRHSLSAVSYS